MYIIHYPNNRTITINHKGEALIWLQFAMNDLCTIYKQGIVLAPVHSKDEL